MTLTDKTSVLRNKIKLKQSKICIMGLGQVGIPTSLSFLKAGFKVIGYDVDRDLVKMLSKGKCNIPEQGLNELIYKYIDKDLLGLTSDPKSIGDSDVIIICVPTPLDLKGNKADLTFLKNATSQVAKFLTSEKLIVIESSIPPMTMEEFIIPTLEHISGQKAGKDFLVSFCPERIAPGKALDEFRTNDRIIGSNDEESYIATYLLFKDLTSGRIHRTDVRTAEISKLAENSYRDINIAFANELAILCEQFRVDVMDVIKAANTHPRVNIHRPGAGVGGPCIPKDPYLLIMGKRFKSSIIRTARAVNESMPAHVAQILIDVINRNRKQENLKILILGVSYKPDTCDSRNSPTEGILLALKQAGFKDISAHDPFVTS